MSEDDVQHFLESNQEVFKRAIAEIEQLVGFFVADWERICKVSVERIENARIKDARRVFAKARRKGRPRPTASCSAATTRRGGAAFPFPIFLAFACLCVRSTTWPR
jgi:hypothetical protein